MGNLSPIGIYLYEDVYYRQWITEVALAFYEGRQDEFVWLDLLKQFRNPEKQQIIPVNFTKEIIDETSILYKEDAVYQILDSEDKPLPKDQKLWEQVMEKCRYRMTMDKMDRWCKLLGTVLIKVGVVDPNTGLIVEKTEPGDIQLDIMHGGVYDARYGASPYHITELVIGLGQSFSGFASGPSATMTNLLGLRGVSMSAQADMLYEPKKVGYDNLGSINKVYWTPTQHKVEADSKDYYEVDNPYGVIPAVAFFNQDPAHYYFLPINEPLIYANHAVNMRLSDLNHIAKFQSFGVPVVKGIERPKSVRQGRPVDDFNQLKGGAASSRFGGMGASTGFGAGGTFRNFDSGFGGLFRDGNADANSLGFSIGPDTAIAVGEKGDFSFAHPNADLRGLIDVIKSMTDTVRINHGLRAKHSDSLPPSGFAAWTEKQGVIDENAGRRGKLMAEREAQLFQVIKKVWNVHHPKGPKFSEDSKLKVTYQMPRFPLDPKTNMEKTMMETTLLDKGDRQAYKAVYPHLTDTEINKLIKQRRKDKREQALADAELNIEVGTMYAAAGLVQEQGTTSISTSEVKVSEQHSRSIKSPGEGGSPAGVQGMDNKLKDSQEKSKQYKTKNEVKPD